MADKYTFPAELIPVVPEGRYLKEYSDRGPVVPEAEVPEAEVQGAFDLSRRDSQERRAEEVAGGASMGMTGRVSEPSLVPEYPTESLGGEVHVRPDEVSGGPDDAFWSLYLPKALSGAVDTIAAPFDLATSGAA